jgi:undecaprenyl-diphosphatase
MNSPQSKRVAAKRHLRNVYIRLQTLAGSILFLGLFVAASALSFFAWLADEVTDGDTLALDETARLYVNGFASEPLTALMNSVTLLGSTLFLSVVFICVLIIFIRRNWTRSAVLLTAAMLGAVILNFVLKVNFARPRPIPFFGTPLPDSYSFPSGHALFAMCFYGALAWLIAVRVPSKSVKTLIWMSAFVIVLLIGLSRIYLSVHYLSDVLAGYAAATVWILTIISTDSILKNRISFLKKQTPND